MFYYFENISSAFYQELIKDYDVRLVSYQEPSDIT